MRLFSFWLWQLGEWKFLSLQLGSQEVGWFCCLKKVNSVHVKFEVSVECLSGNI